MRPYLHLIEKVLKEGHKKSNRTGIDTLSIFGFQLQFSLQKGFPCLTTKQIHFKSIVHELLWMIKGDTNIRYLNENGVNIWNEWADKNGDLGPIYGKQWRHWQSGENQSIDQLKQLVEQIKTEPNSRRHIISAWNVGEIDQMNLPPCHILAQFDVTDDQLSCQLYQRSADVFLGLPFNIASYSLLTAMIAQTCKLKVGRFVWTGGDIHLYENHLEQAQEQLKREPKELPKLYLNPSVDDLFDFTYEDIKLHNYDPHPAITAPVSV